MHDGFFFNVCCRVDLICSISFDSVITDLIQEARETKDAIEEATGAMHKKDDAMAVASNFESNMLDFHGAPAPAPIPAPETMYSSAPPPSTQSSMPPPAAMAPTMVVQTVSSDDEQDGNKDNAPKEADDAPESFSNEYGQPPEPTPAPSTTQPPPQQYQAPPTPQYEQPTIYNQGGPSPSVVRVPPTPPYEQPAAYASQPPSAQPSPARPATLDAHHPRQSSLGFNPEFLMGGSAEALPEVDANGISPAARTKSSSGDFGYDDEETFQNVENLKKQAESAAETAREAEAAHQRLLNEADELRSDADRAEATARSLKASAQEKKKGRFGRGGGDKKKILVR